MKASAAKPAEDKQTSELLVGLFYIDLNRYRHLLPEQYLKNVSLVIYWLRENHGLILS